VRNLRNSVSFILCLLLACTVTANQTQKVEVTQTDFTKESKIISTELTVFGVGLGDSLADVKAKVEHGGIKLTVTDGRYSLFDGGEELVGIGFESDKIVRLALFYGMVKRLAGESAQLLGADSTSPDSAVRIHLLGREDRRSVEQSSIGHTVTCSYDKEGIHLIRLYSKYGDAPTVLHFVLPARAR